MADWCRDEQGLAGRPANPMKVMAKKRVRTEDSRIVHGHDCALPNDRDVQRLLTVSR